MENLIPRGDDRNRNAFSIEVDSKNILLWNQFNLFFGKIRNNLQVGSQSISLATPSLLEEIGVSLKVAVLDDWNRNRVPGKKRKLHKWHSLIESLAVPRDIEFEGNTSCLSFAPPNITFNITNNLRIKRGAFLGI
jgi:hypothetical protein